MFTERQSYEYLKELQDIIKSINNTPSRPLKRMAPSDVNETNEDEVRLNQYLVRRKTKLPTEITKRKTSVKVKKSRKHRKKQVSMIWYN